MIVGRQKPLDEIFRMISENEINKLLLGGCGTCVTISFAGGEREVEELATTLALKAKKEGYALEIRQTNPLRQCEPEFTDAMAEDVAWAEAVLSLSCGVGVQTLAERFSSKRVLPGVNTMMLGSHAADRVFMEYCGACGDCVLDKTGGVCPIVRCSKSMLNGPCGGSVGGKCEVSKEIDCAWQLIYDRLNELGLADHLDENVGARDWRAGWQGAPRRIQQ
jgi:hypothetical protein